MRQRNMFQTREQDKNPEKTLTSRDKQFTWKRVQSKSHKDAHHSGEEWMKMVKTSTDRKHKKVPSGKYRAEEYTNWSEKDTRGNQQQPRWTRRKNQWSGRQQWNSPKQSNKKKKMILKNEDSFRDPWNDIRRINIHSIGFPERERREKGQKIYLKK